MCSTIGNLVNFSYETSNSAVHLLIFRPSCYYRISRSRPTYGRMCLGSALAHPRETLASGIHVCASETFGGTGAPMYALPLKRPVENWFRHPRATPGNEMARQIARSCKHSPASRASAAQCTTGGCRIEGWFGYVSWIWKLLSRAFRGYALRGRSAGGETGKQFAIPCA